ncbi:50S ribosomal subunit protein L17 [Candidatus Hodgkinia cicadicola]|uniref:50S ribosomal protein L17 n=1 Tax=Candidatus Hodgkinia cicadicola TaxID=573658 RepID=A0ABX4MFK2_9HYPH|nr:50S ribosomal subunit protein L17 [Candidatus Hodgkinia cicadicola]
MSLLRHGITNLTRDFIKNRRTISTIRWLRHVQVNVERIIKIVKSINKDNLQKSIRLLRSRLRCNSSFALQTVYLLARIKPMNGGWTKIIKLWRRDGDNAFMSALILSR